SRKRPSGSESTDGVYGIRVRPPSYNSADKCAILPVLKRSNDLEQAALAWLYSLADQERGVGWNPRSSPDEQWKLGRTRALLALAGAPDRSLRIALVAGTKGKGSTCAMLASLLGAAGVRCGLYSNPH